MADETKTKAKTEAPAVAYRYVQTEHGYNFPGIPARDLTAEEFAALSDEDKRNVTESGVYEKVK